MLSYKQYNRGDLSGEGSFLLKEDKEGKNLHLE